MRGGGQGLRAHPHTSSRSPQKRNGVRAHRSLKPRQKKALAHATQHIRGGPALPEASLDLLPGPLRTKWVPDECVPRLLQLFPSTIMAPRSCCPARTKDRPCPLPLTQLQEAPSSGGPGPAPEASSTQGERHHIARSTEAEARVPVPFPAYSCLTAGGLGGLEVRGPTECQGSPPAPEGSLGVGKH